MKEKSPHFEVLPIEQVEVDPNQPRQELGIDGKENRLLVSIRELSIQQPIVVTQVDNKRFRILDGHRRYICAKELGMKRVPCRILDSLPVGDLERIRFEVQNNRKNWKPIERSDCLSRIKDTKKFKTNSELANFLHLSETAVNSSLMLRQLTMHLIGKMEKYELSQTYRVEFVRMKPKLRKIRDLEEPKIVDILFEKVKNKVIKNAKDFRRLGRIFQRAHHNEEALYKFLTDPDMSIGELYEIAVTSKHTLLGEQFMKEISSKLSQGQAFTDQEREFLKELQDLLGKALKA